MGFKVIKPKSISDILKSMGVDSKPPSPEFPIKKGDIFYHETLPGTLEVISVKDVGNRNESTCLVRFFKDGNKKATCVSSVTFSHIFMYVDAKIYKPMTRKEFICHKRTIKYIY